MLVFNPFNEDLDSDNLTCQASGCDGIYGCNSTYDD